MHFNLCILISVTKGLLDSVPPSGHPITGNIYDGEAVFGRWPETHVAQMEGPYTASDQMGSYRLAFPLPLVSWRPANSHLQSPSLRCTELYLVAQFIHPRIKTEISFTSSVFIYFFSILTITPLKHMNTFSQ